jgi:hypothetical protein
MTWMEETYKLGIEAIDFGKECKSGRRFEYVNVGYNSGGKRLEYVYRRESSKSRIMQEAKDLQTRIRKLHRCKLDLDIIVKEAKLDDCSGIIPVEGGKQIDLRRDMVEEYRNRIARTAERDSYLSEMNKAPGGSWDKDNR